MHIDRQTARPESDEVRVNRVTCKPSNDYSCAKLGRQFSGRKMH